MGTVFPVLLPRLCYYLTSPSSAVATSQALGAMAIPPTSVTTTSSILTMEYPEIFSDDSSHPMELLLQILHLHLY